MRYVRNEHAHSHIRHNKSFKRTSITDVSSEEGSDIAFVVKRMWNTEKTKEKTSIILKGQDLRRVMYSVMGKLLEHYQYRDWVAQEQTIDEPVANELWYWNELSAAAKPPGGSDQGREDLQLLLDHLSNIDVDGVKLVKSIASMTKIFAKDLWCLYRPGTLVISKPFQDEPQLFRVHDCSFKEDGDRKTFVVVAWAFSWTGAELVQEYYSFTVGDYSKIYEELTITDLPCYPLQHYKNSDGAYGSDAVEALKTELLRRGRVFRELCRESVHGRQHTYDGDLLTDDVESELYEYRYNKVSTTSRQREIVRI